MNLTNYALDQALILAGAQRLKLQTGRSDHSLDECRVAGALGLIQQGSEYSRFKQSLDTPSPTG